MGNCQAAAAAAAVVIQDPLGGGNKAQRIYRTVSANEVMNSYPGHYVAMVIAAPVKQLKLLGPTDTLLLGHVYRLVSFEDVLKEFAARKCVKLGKLLKQIGASNMEIIKHEHRNSNWDSSNNASPTVAYQSRGVGRRSCCVGGQWRPTLQTISEFGTIN